MKSLLLCFLLLGSIGAHADRGHRVLVCDDQSNFQILGLYDFNESFEKSSLSSSDHINEVLEKISRKNPWLEVAVKQEIDNLKSSNVLVMTNTDLQKSSDSGNESNFRICPGARETKSIQVASNLSSGKFEVNEPIYKLLSKRDQAGLFVSAALYNILLKVYPKEKQNGLMAGRLNVVLFSEQEIDESEFAKKHFEEIFKILYADPILAFEKSVVTKWSGYQNVSEANEYLRTASTTLNYGIQYKSSITPESLPPLHIAKIKGVNYPTPYLGDNLVIMGSLAVAGLGLPVAIIGNIAAEGVAVGAAGALWTTAGVMIVGGLGVAGVTAASIGIYFVVKRVKLQRIKDFLVEAYNCQLSEYKCDSEDYEHIQNAYAKFTANSDVAITFQHYVDRVVELTYQGDLMGMKRKQMEAVVNASF